MGCECDAITLQLAQSFPDFCEGAAACKVDCDDQRGDLHAHELHEMNFQNLYTRKEETKLKKHVNSTNVYTKHSDLSNKETDVL